MKRSKAVALSLMGTSAVLLQACDDPQIEAKVYRDIQNCITTGELSQEQCIDIHKDALAAHLKTAPKYRSREDCYADFGYEKCQQPQQRQQASGGSGNVWMPLLMGFMAAKALDGVSGGGRRGAPLYRSSDDPNTLRTSRNYPVGKSYGTQTKLPTWATQPTRTRTRTLSRGGFGARSSGWGG